MLRKTLQRLVSILRDQTGSLQSLTWVLGATVVTVLVVVALMQIMPGTTTNFFQAATQWIRSQFGF
ncbi:cell division protein FtsX [Desulfofundulus luciae]|uniref:Cell division protein FtsX n=1 Tax=Desulfofundulus luciae TaxID=74702 RepID=A0ABU0B449_9FIRM|nr:hypothetical protein [Desulfofundulus luciae]MDQ0287495.1 cell division protein FtsX [Desulfofundulus luciae]